MGKVLQRGELSRSGLYGICKSDSGWPLRVTLFSSLASWWTEDNSRQIREIYVSNNLLTCASAMMDES